MPSPQIITFFLFTGGNTPVTGATPSFITYKDETGANLSQPTIHEIGGGAYYFTPVFTVGHGIAYVIGTGVANPPLVYGYLRPEGFGVDSLLDEAFGKWQIMTTGPDINKLVLYRSDGTVLQKFLLEDGAGTPTYINPYARIPTT